MAVYSCCKLIYPQMIGRLQTELWGGEPFSFQYLQLSVSCLCLSCCLGEEDLLVFTVPSSQGHSAVL